MDRVVVFMLAVAGVIMYASSKKGDASAKQDTPVSLDDIRQVVKTNRQLTAVLTRVDGQPAISMSRKVNDGRTYTKVYPISEADYQTLRAEGFGNYEKISFNSPVVSVRDTGRM